MHLVRLALRSFRNLEAVELAPHPRFNVLVGENGQGKTNLLEGAYWLATLRPLRASRLRELVRWGDRDCRVEGVVLHEGLEHRLAVAVEGGERQAYREGKPARATAYFGALAAVVFSPDEVGLVRGPPVDRRRFLDRAIFTGRPAHLTDVLAYRRALEARNRLLREAAPDDLLGAYEAALARAGARLVEARRRYVEQLAPRFAAAFAAISGAEPAGELRYRPSVDAGVEGLEAAWTDDRERDRDRGYTLRGPHADDLALSLFDRTARTYASQGQQRALVLALKIAEIELLEQSAGFSPVLLLDDVSSELDPRRNARLFEFLEGFGGQVFITTTDVSFLRIGAARHVFRVEGGRVAPVEA